VQKQEETEELELFFNSIKSEATRSKYRSYWKKYLELTGMTVKELLAEKDPRIIERQIIDLIIKMKNEGKSWGSIHNYVAMIQAFYKINDIVLNVSKINKFLPEHRRVRKNDRGYTHEEISKMLEFCDIRTRVIVLLLASTGMRIGAIPLLRIGNIDNYKITVYENSKDEYFSFMTPECKTAIDNYIDMRLRYGEKINDDSYLIREQFDIRDKFAIAKCRSLSVETLLWKLKAIAKRSNVRNKQVPIAHGFRKFFTTQLIKSNVNSIHGLMLEGHSTGIRDHYARPTEQDMYDEYMKAVNQLTINEENRLKIKVQSLERDKISYERLDAKIEALQRAFFKNNVTVSTNDLTEDERRPMTDQEIENEISLGRQKRKARRNVQNKLIQELENEEKRFST
jgi:integrase